MGVINFTGKMWGGNIVPTPAQVATGVAAWTNLFIDWDWNGWVKPQVDAAASAGANCIGLIGCMDGVHSGAITQSTVNSRWVQLANYCQSLGLALYPKPCAYNQLTGCTNAEVATYVLSILNAISGLVTVIGVDVISEADNWDDGGGSGTQANADRCIAMYGLIDAGTPLTLTFSIANEWNGAYARAWAAKLVHFACDYLDFHPFAYNGWGTPIDTADVAYWESTYSLRSIIFGEGGSAQSDSITQQNAFANGLLYLMNQADQWLRGWCVWAITDQSATSSEQWGMYNGSFVARTNLVSTFGWYALPRPPRKGHL